LDPRQAQPVALQFHTRRSLDNLQGGVVYEQDFSASDSIRTMLYTGTRSNQQYLAIPLTTTSQFAITSAGGVSAFDRNFYGGSLWWTHRMDLLGGPLTVTTGGDYDRANEARKGFLNEFGLQGAPKRNENNSVYSWGGFAQAEWELAPQWSLSAGLRYTDVSFSSEDHFICTQTVNTTGTPLGTCSGFLTADGTALRPITTAVNPDDSGSQSYAAWTPVGGLLYRLSPTTNLYASIGRSFETPTLIEVANRPDGGTGLNFTLQPSISNQYEVGAKMFVGGDTRINADLFYIHTQNEIVVATNQGGRTTFQNAGDTQRKGAELSVDTRLGYGFGGYLALTYLQAEFQNPFLSCNGTPCRTVPPLLNTAPVSAGNKIPGVPPFTVFGELSYAYAPWGFSAAAEVYGQGKVYVNDTNSEAAGEYWIVSLRGGFNQNWRGLRLAEFIRFNNVFDRQYIGAVSVNDANGRFYAPAAGINFLAGVTASYQF
jgi:iron complex outermembrane recepter protein